MSNVLSYSGLKTSTLNIWSIKNTQVHTIKKLILKLNHGYLDFKPPGGSGIFTNVTNRSSKELSVNMN